jgi:hypothetical protein
MADDPAEEHAASASPARKRRLVIGAFFAASVALWVLASALKPVPLIAGLIWATVLRGIYIFIRRRGKPDHPFRKPEHLFWTPWLFVLAAACTVFSLVGLQARENNKTDKAAVARGVAQKGETVTPVQRCVTKVLQHVDTVAEQRTLIPRDVRPFATRLCETAQKKGALATSGAIYTSGIR